MNPNQFLLQLGELHTFQTFDDSGRKNPSLSRVLHGTLSEHSFTLGRLNERGAGVFVMVNQGDGLGRRAANVRQVRALFVDLDGAPLAPLLSANLPPHCVVESSPGRWHAYWFVTNCPISDFKPLQKGLARFFQGDTAVSDLSRVMRLPGFDHRKREPFRSKIVEWRVGEKYCVSDLRDCFSLDQQPSLNSTPRVQTGRIPEGRRNSELFSRARSFVQKGFDAAGILSRLHSLNETRCDPPLVASEVDSIAARAIAYGSDGFTILPHRLLDSQEWRKSSPQVHELIVTAFRIYNGSNNGNIALTWADFNGRSGFANKHTFYRYRLAATNTGIVIRVGEGQRTQLGRKPDLFAIASQWLRPTSLVSKMEPCADVQNVHPYIDKHSLFSNASVLINNGTNPAEAA